MRWRGASVALILLATVGCDRLSDPVTAAIFFAPDLGVPVDVTKSLPTKREDALRLLAKFGYEPDSDLARAASFVPASGDGRSVLEMYHVPDVSRNESVAERLYLLKGFEGQARGDGYGLIFDVGYGGQVLTVIGFKAFEFFI